ncbi:MAG: cytochrome c [Verrucomicrobia bacterium]|nr:cytochrome c [Verrucomicrobiota bacterium]
MNVQNKSFQYMKLAVSVVAIVVASLVLTTASAQDALKTATNTWTAPARAARKVNPIPANEQTVAQGKQLFIAACLACHGPAGKGDGPAAVSLERNGVKIRPGNLSDPRMRQQPDGAIFWKISEGNSPMPTFGEALTEEQRWLVVTYVRTLAPQTMATAKAE